MTDATHPPPMPPPGVSPPAGAAVVDSSGVVTASVPCRKCSYNVRGLAVTGLCPECGAPIGVAIHGDQLRYSDPQWLRNLSRGAGLAFWGIFVSMAATIVGGIAAEMTTPLLAPLAEFAGGIVYLYGAWLLTEPDPSGLGEKKYGRARQIIRVSLMGGLVGIFFDALLATIDADRATTIVLNVLTFAADLLTIVGHFAMLRYLERLALRIPDPRLSARARLVMWGYGLSWAAVIVVGGAAAIGVAASGVLAPGAAEPSGGFIGALAGAGCAVGIAFLVMLAFGIIFLVLLFQLRRAFAQQAEIARQVWSGERLTAPVDPGGPLASHHGRWGKMPPP